MNIDNIIILFAAVQNLFLFIPNMAGAYTSLMRLFFSMEILLLAQSLVPSSRSSLVREQALTYPSFDTAFTNGSGQIRASGNFTHVLVRKGIYDRTANSA